MGAGHVKHLSDAEIDRIAHAQDDEGWLVRQLTKMEWRAFAHDIERAAVAKARGESFRIADAQMLIVLRSYAVRLSENVYRLPNPRDPALAEAVKWLGARGLTVFMEDAPDERVRIVTEVP